MNRKINLVRRLGKIKNGGMITWRASVKATSPTFRGDSGTRRCITQGEKQDAELLIIIGAVAGFLAEKGYRLLPFQQRGCRLVRAVAFVSAFQLLTCSPERHPFIRKTLSFGVSDIDDGWADTRFLRQDLYPLMAALRIPPTLTMENGGVCRGDEAFLVMLMRLSSAERLLSLMPTVGREYTQIYRMEKAAREYLDDTWKHLLLNNWNFLAERLEMFNQHFVAKYLEVNGLAVVPPCHLDIAVAMDGHKRPIPRPTVRKTRVWHYTPYVIYLSLFAE